jgi:hypothetical protein
MTEAEFNHCTDPKAMLWWLDREGHASLRRLKLLFGACCGRIVEQGDKPAGPSHGRHARGAAEEVDEIGGPIALVGEHARSMLLFAAEEALNAVRGGNQTRAALIRDIFGPHPFRPVRVAPRVLGWRDGIVVKLARSIDAESRHHRGTLHPDRLVVLAAFLITAGCTDASLVEHLRGEGPHVCGCWAVDCLLAGD